MTNTDYLKTLAERIESEGFGSGSHGLANLKEALEVIANELESLRGKKEKKP
jgi:hypothetical protein